MNTFKNLFNSIKNLFKNLFINNSDELEELKKIVNYINHYKTLEKERAKQELINLLDDLEKEINHLKEEKTKKQKRLTEKERKRIVYLYHKKWYSIYKIADEMKCTRKTIYRWIKNYSFYI